jgi:hypothetical protein
MSVTEVSGESGPDDRRRDERRLNSRLADLSVPEFRRIALTWLLSAVVIAMFLWTGWSARCSSRGSSAS